MIIKDQYGNEIEVRDIVLESENEFLSIQVIDGKIVFTLNDERITHGQLDELLHDDHPQYLDAIRHEEVDHTSIVHIDDISQIENVNILDPANGDVLTFINGEWKESTPQTTRNHELLDNLNSDSHAQYMHKDESRIITAAHVYDTNGQAFILSGKAIGALIAGLNAELLNGKSASDFALANHIHTYYNVPDHQHDGSDIIGVVSQAQNAVTVGNKTVDRLAPLVHTHIGDQIISRVPDSSLLEGHASDYFAPANHTHTYAEIEEGVTGGNDHIHDGILTKKVDHNNLVNCGQNTHADIDLHLQNYTNPHNVTKTQVGLGNVDNLKQIPMSLLTTKGDLVIGTGTGVNRLAVGVNNSIPVADSTQALGIRWTPFSTLMGGPYAPLEHIHNYAPLEHIHNYALLDHDHDLVYFKRSGGVISGNIFMNGNRLSELPEPQESSEAATKSYVDFKTANYVYVEEVINILNTPPDAQIGDRYIVGDNPTGDWLLYPYYIAEKTSSGWEFAMPVNGTVCPVTDMNNLYIYDSVNKWYPFNISVDHGLALGLSDDDHLQYAHISKSRTISGAWTFVTPFLIDTTSLIVNLNADKLDGLDASAFSLTNHTHTESDATILKYYRNNGTWDDPAARFAPLSHNHNDLYFTKAQLQTSGQSLVHWDNLMSKPSGFVPNVHGSSHAAGGIDQIDVNGLSGVLAQDQKAQSHDLLSKHTISGLTTGHFMKATSPTTFGFVAHGLTYTDVGAAANIHNHDSDYSQVSHNHNTLYAALIHTHEYALPDHNHNTVYAPLIHIHSNYAPTSHDHNALYAPIANGITNGDAHDHSGGDGAQIDHTNLKNNGSNTHSQIDTHLANVGMHRVIDDNSVTATNLWSAEKISTQLGTKSNTTHNHSGVYEPANANIQAHIISLHAPSNAQKNSDITKSEIEEKLIGEIDTHSHALPDHTHTQVDIEGLDDNIISIQEFILTKGQPDGIASLDADGKVPTGQLPDLAPGVMILKGEFDGSSLPEDPEVGWTYICSTAGGVYLVGDQIIWDGTSWIHIPNTDAVLSVDGRTGAVTLSDRYAALSHTHAQSSITNLVTDLAGKAALSHSHAIANVTNLQTTLDGKAALSHSHSDATASAAGFMSAADKTKLNGLSNYTHPTGDGNLHVPLTSTTNNLKVLKAGATAGSIAWGNVAWDEITNKPLTFTPATHTHTQAQSHNSPDTDTATSALHHTLGTGANQAAAGSHAAQHKSGGVDAILLSDLGGTLAVSKTHASPDTDASATALHHTLGIGQYQAAAGNHTHSTYALTSHNHTGVYQPIDEDLTAIAALSGTTGLLKKTAANTWALDTSVYLTSITKAMVEAVLTGAISTHTHSTVASHTHAIADVTNLQATLDAKAPLASPALTGTPTAPTPATGDNTTRLANTAFVIANSARATHSHSEYALTSHTHAIANVTNLQTTLDAKSAVGHTHIMTQAIEFVIDGGGALPSTGVKGCIEVPFACTVTGWKIIADVVGSVTAPINLYTYANYPNTASSQISMSLASAIKNTGSVSVAIAAGTILQFNISSVATVTRFTISLTVTRTV